MCMFVYDFVSFDTHTQTNAHAGKSMFFVCVCVCVHSITSIYAYWRT